MGMSAMAQGFKTLNVSSATCVSRGNIVIQLGQRVMEPLTSTLTHRQVAKIALRTVVSGTASCGLNALEMSLATASAQHVAVAVSGSTGHLNGEIVVEPV